MRAALLACSPVGVLFLVLLLQLGSNVGAYLLCVGWGKPLYAYLPLLVFAVGRLINLVDQPEFILSLTFVMLDATLRDPRRAREAMAHRWAVAA